MNDEEKKAIDELKEEINKPVEVQGNKFNTFILYNIESAKTILNLIKKQSKEIEELKTTKKELTERVLRLESDKFWDNVVSKDKIKAKIEEYRRLLYSYEKDLEEKLHYVDKGSMNCIIAQLQILQSLLEKE